jgi:hypothetical protein
MQTERRHLNMHKKLLLDVIKRQAGTLHKAILEGIMNGIEAGATRVDISYLASPKPTLRITDNGKGIATVEAIEQFFETFGTPHDESEGKIWAQFRMGRGQLFSFGSNVWRTGTFRMLVDIEANGLSYDLTQNLAPVNGCDIEIALYKDPIADKQYPSLEALERAIREQIEFMATPIYFNGKRLNRDPKGLKWTHQDDDAYYLFGVGNGLTIYNIGAYVLTKQTYQVGVTGVVVSKKQLKVNFARNDIQSDCEVYRRIRKVIDANRRDKARNTRNVLTQAERVAMLTDLIDGGVKYEDIKGLSLLKTTSGRNIKIGDICKNGLPWAFAPANDMKADKVMQHKRGICLDRELLGCLDYNGEPKEFFNWLLRRAWESDWERDREMKKWAVVPNLYRTFDQLSASIRDGFRILAPSELTAKEKVLLRLLNDRKFCSWKNRVVNIGLSEVAAAWTDGQSYIAIDRHWLDGIYYNSTTGAAKLINVMVHEMAHDTDSSNTHVHGEEFYREFHDICLGDAPPQALIADFYKRLNASKIAKQHEDAERRAERLDAKKDAAFGIAAAPKQ